MEYISEEKKRRLYLAGLITEEFSISEAQDITTTADDEFEVEKNRKNSPVKDSELEFTKNYSGTNEDDYLNFAQKAALIVGSKTAYESIITNIIGTLVMEVTKELNASSTIPFSRMNSQQKADHSQAIANEVKSRLDPTLRDSINIDGLIYQLFSNIETKVGRLNIDAPTKINKLDKDATKLAKAEKHFSQQADKETFTAELKRQLEALRRNNAFVTGDEKASISYKFSADDNETKLSPLGYWQIQFLSRAAANQPKNELEEILFKNGRYAGKAIQMLRNFYDAAFQKSAAILMGRGYNENPNDHEFKIAKENALDKVFDGLIEGQYDTERGNFGAWAFTVAHNHIVNEIKTITDRHFNSSAQILDAFESADFRELSFNTEPTYHIPGNPKMQTGIAEEFNATKINSDKRGITYSFETPLDLFDYINIDARANRATSPQLSPNWINNLTTESRNALKSFGAFDSIKKDADYAQGEEESVFDGFTEQLQGEERDEEFIRLTDSITEGSTSGFKINKIKRLDEYQKLVALGAEEGIGEEEIEMKFKRDFGKLLYMLQAENIVNRPFWEAIPTKEFKEAFLKYAQENDILKIAQKALNSIKIGDHIVNNIFFEGQDSNGALLKFEVDGEIYNVEDFATYSEIKAKGGLKAKMKDDFIQNQTDKRKTDKFTFVFDDDQDLNAIWSKADDLILSLNIADKDKRLSGFTYTDKNKDEMEQVFHNTFVNNPPYEIPEIKTYITSKLKLDPNMSVDELSQLFHSGRSSDTDSKEMLGTKIERFFMKDDGYKKLIDKYKNVGEKAANMYTKEKHKNQISDIFSNLSGFDVTLEESILNDLKQQLLEMKIFKKTIL